MANMINITWSTGSLVVQSGQRATIGRSSRCEVRVPNERVSRTHAEVLEEGGVWVLRDLGSSGGVFVNGQRVASVRLDAPVSLMLGDVAVGERVNLSPMAAAASVGGGGGTQMTEAAELGTVIGTPFRERPGGALVAQPSGAPTVVEGDTISVELEGRTLIFAPGDEVHIGRDSSNAVITANPTVSRVHATLRHDGTSWIYEDKASAGGSFVDRRQVSKVPVAGSMAVTLGSRDAGARLVLVASGTQQRSLRNRLLSRGWMPIVAAAAAVVVVAAALVVLTSRDGGGGSSSADLSRLKLATVKLITTDVDGRQAVGSGSIVSEDGLIITNAHVAAPDAPGMNTSGTTPGSRVTSIEVFVTEEPGRAAEPRFLAEVVAVDGYLDVAVIRITKTLTGRRIDDGEDLGLTAVSLGDSSSLSSGDDLIVLGFPLLAGSDEVTVKEGVVSSPVGDDRLESARAFLNIDIDISGGNSGGLAADSKGRLVGIPTQDRTDRRNEQIAQMRPIDLAKPVFKAAQAGTEYVSPFVTPLTEEAANVTGFAVPSREPFDIGRVSTTTRVDLDTVAIALTYEGFPAGHQDVGVSVVDSAGQELGSVTSGRNFPVKWGSAGSATVTVPLGEALQVGEPYTVVVTAGPNLERTLDSFEFRLR